MATVIAFPFAVLFAVLFAITLSVWQAYVATILWGWFMVPFGLPVLSIAWAIGLSCFFTAIKPTPYIPSGKDPALKDAVLGSLRPILNPAFALLIGWVALQWMTP